MIHWIQLVLGQTLKWDGPKLEPTNMISELQKLIVLPVAFGLFLFAAQGAAGLTWRGAPAAVIAVASR